MRPGLVRRAATLLVWGLAFWVLLSIGSRGNTFRARRRAQPSPLGHGDLADRMGRPGLALIEWGRSGVIG